MGRLKKNIKQKKKKNIPHFQTAIVHVKMRPLTLAEIMEIIKILHPNIHLEGYLQDFLQHARERYGWTENWRKSKDQVNNSDVQDNLQKDVYEDGVREVHTEVVYDVYIQGEEFFSSRPVQKKVRKPLEIIDIVGVVEDAIIEPNTNLETLNDSDAENI